MSTRRILSLPTNLPTAANVDTLVADALSVIEMELIKFKSKVKGGRSLEPKEGTLLNGYVKSLIELSKEDRERNKDLDLSKLPTSELLRVLLDSGDAEIVASLKDYVAKKNEPVKT